MKTTIILLAIIALFFSSCSKDVEVCVDGNFNPTELGTQTYTWCGENADQIFWTISAPNGNSATYITEEGDVLEINHEFLIKGIHSIYVEAKNKRKEESFGAQITVGEYELRVEPVDCGGSNFNQSTEYEAFLYVDYANLQEDLRNNSTTNSISSTTLPRSNYYNNQVHTDGSQINCGGFKNMPNGEYVVYIKETGGSNSNLLDLVYYENMVTIGIPQEYSGYDYMYNPVVNDYDASLVLNLFSKTYLLTDVLVDGTSSGVSTCNADDNIIFNIDGTWTYDVGADNCTGNQTTSQGTFSGINNCSYIAGSSIYMTPTSGSMLNFSYYLSFDSQTKIILTSYTGNNTIKQIFTMQ